MPARKKIKKKTSFVPRVVFATALVGAAVIPLCVTACGGKVEGGARADSGLGFTVAAQTFDSGPGFSVADVGFDSGGGIGPTVAAMAFDSGPGFGVADTGFLGSVAAIGFDSGPGLGVADVGFTVAAMGFDSGLDSGKPGDAGEG